MLPNLSPRSEGILRSLIETYLLEGEPVGSRLLAKHNEEALSSATIRNVLSDLEDEHLVAQPHTSAGRVPTELAYRYYIDRWVRPRTPTPELGHQLEPAFEGLDQDPETWLRHASRVLSEVMQGVCLAIPLPLLGSRLMRLEFVPLGPFRLVAVWVGSGGEVEHQIMENPRRLSAETLVELGNFASSRFAGLTLDEMRTRLLLALQDRADEARQLTQRLSDLAANLRHPDSAGEPPVVVSGLHELGRVPEFEDLDRFRNLVSAFEEHERLARLLIAFAEAAARDVQVLLGSENPYLPAMPLATALRTVQLHTRDAFAFAFVGPMRLDYPKVLGGLAWWSEEVARRSRIL